ncbi:DUF5359 family protein [Falsibacillus albus]|uniref:YpfB family protein n=1 Tax=Falsibacillus albus TaxID=2478915 RepID=A0A3L7JX22_9BACI|nr:DUF5359 family protein [Falsibacillus albus]RLQ95080.1 hypothetical protein D9X91_11295 [Falsibacillus albus]
MRTIERWIIKLAIIQFIILIISQFILHDLHMFPQMNKIMLYEGVQKLNYTEIKETIEGMTR